MRIWSLNDEIIDARTIISSYEHIHKNTNKNNSYTNHLAEMNFSKDIYPTTIYRKSSRGKMSMESVT